MVVRGNISAKESPSICGQSIFVKEKFRPTWVVPPDLISLDVANMPLESTPKLLRIVFVHLNISIDGHDTGPQSPESFSSSTKHATCGLSPLLGWRWGWRS